MKWTPAVLSTGCQDPTTVAMQMSTCILICLSVHTLLPAPILKMSQTPLPPKVPSSHPSMSLQDLLVNRIGHPCMAVSHSSTASCWFLKDLSKAVLECCCSRICLSRSMRRTTISARCASTASCCVERERGCESIAHLQQNRNARSQPSMPSTCQVCRDQACLSIFEDSLKIL